MDNENTQGGGAPQVAERPRYGAGPPMDDRPSRFGAGAAGERGSDRGERSGGGFRGRGGGRRGGPPRRKQPIYADNEVVDYKDISRLRLAIDERGKILPRRKTHCSAHTQRQ